MPEAKTVTSAPGLTQEEALVSLQSHPEYRAGTKIASIRRRKDRWVAKLIEPKTAEFPPGSDDEGDEEAPPKGPPSDGPDDEAPADDGPPSPDGPPSDDGDGPPKKEKGGEKHELSQILDLLHSVVEALGIAPPDAGLLGGPDGPPPPGAGPPHGGPPPPPPHGGPDGGKPPLFGGGPKALKPGDAPPGTTPVGAPAFASVQHMASRVPSFTASTSDDLSIQAAKADLDKEFGPFYKVKQIKRDRRSNQLHALLSVR